MDGLKGQIGSGKCTNLRVCFGSGMGMLLGGRGQVDLVAVLEKGRICACFFPFFSSIFLGWVSLCGKGERQGVFFGGFWSRGLMEEEEEEEGKDTKES